MDIRIIKNADSIKGKIINNKKVLQTEETLSQYMGVKKVRMYLFDLEKNIRKEIASGYEKYNFFHIVNLKKNTNLVYYTEMEEMDNEKIRIILHKYDADSSVDEAIYTFLDDLSLYEEYKRVKLFVINEYYFLMQNEYIRYNLAESYKGYFEYEQFLYNVKDHKMYDVKDEHLKCSGIKKMAALSERTCIIKTGYSLLKDNRYRIMDKTEAVPEGIHLADMGQFVADIIQGNKNIAMNTLEQSFYKITIPYAKIREDYIIYSKVNNELHEEEVVFYNYKTKESNVCINKNIYEMKDMVFTLTIKGKPYIMLMNSKGTQFLNMIKNKVDLMFSVEEPVQFCVNGMFVVKRKAKGMLGKIIYYTEVYKYPKLNLIHKEKGVCLECVSTAEDNLYLLIDK